MLENLGAGEDKLPCAPSVRRAALCLFYNRKPLSVDVSGNEPMDTSGKAVTCAGVKVQNVWNQISGHRWYRSD